MHLKGADSMAVSGLRFVNALVGSEWATAVLLCMNELRKQSSSQQKQKDCCNPSRVTLVAASLPNNVNTSRSITLLVHYRSPLQFQTFRRVNNSAKSHSHN